MAIKIDLLPGHVKQRRNLELAIAASVLTVALVGTGLAMALDSKKKELGTAKQNLAAVTVVSNQTKAAADTETAAVTAAQPFRDTITFMLTAGKSGPQRAALLNQVRQYIYIDTVVQSIDLSDGQNAVVQASVKNPNQYAQFLFNLRRAGPPPAGTTTTDAGPLFALAPKASGVGGFNNGAAAFVPPAIPTDQPVILVYPLKVTAQGPLKYPIPVIPDPALANGAAGAAGATGAPGGFGGPGASGSPGGPGGPSSSGSPGVSGGPGAPPPPIVPNDRTVPQPAPTPG